MPGEFRIEVDSVERGEAGAGRVHLRLETPEGLEASMLDRQLAGFFAKELGSRVGLRVRRAPWGDGIRVQGGELIVLSGLDPQGQVQLESHARESADECNRDLQPDGQMGSRLHEILRRLQPPG
jgi:hypothetical protein